MTARLACVGLVLMGSAAVVRCDSPSASLPDVHLELIGQDTFWIQDTEVNPGCHYRWVMRATGSVGASAQLLGGRMLRSLDLAAAPKETFHMWSGETIRPLFGSSPVFTPGEERESGSYASVGPDLPPQRIRVEFDYRVHPGGARHVVSRDFYCLRE